MTLGWTLIATILAVEICVMLLLIYPSVDMNKKWKRFFKLKFIAMLSKKGRFFFNLIMGILVFYLVDAIREMRKYTQSESASHELLNIEMEHMKVNFYISGFVFILALVIRRFFALMSTHANLTVQSEASAEEAESARSIAGSLLDEMSKECRENDKILAELNIRVKELTSDLNQKRKDKEGLKSQIEDLKKEYERKEYRLKKITIGVGGK